MNQYWQRYDPNFITIYVNFFRVKKIALRIEHQFLRENSAENKFEILTAQELGSA